MSLVPSSGGGPRGMKIFPVYTLLSILKVNRSKSFKLRLTGLCNLKLNPVPLSFDLNSASPKTELSPILKTWLKVEERYFDL